MLEGLYLAGPLSLNFRKKQADTVMGVRLPLDAYEFDTLYLLATREGEFFTLDAICEVVYNKKNDCSNKLLVKAGLAQLLDKVRDHGEGFMWIDHSPARGYTFQTRWGQKWRVA